MFVKFSTIKEKLNLAIYLAKLGFSLPCDAKLKAIKNKFQKRG
jgi:hypothetical protein